MVLIFVTLFPKKLCNISLGSKNSYAENGDKNQDPDEASVHGIGSSPFEMKWRESILWFRLNFTDLTVYSLPHHLKF
jgi:hypothetical protein